MKKIILIRHGKSAWNQPWLDDHDRPLAERGLNDVPKMAQKLKKKGICPEVILSSTALRAAETARIIAEILGFPADEITFEKNLYHASVSTMMKYIHMQKDSKEVVFLVGHNPGLNELIDHLGGKIDNLATSAQFGFLLDSATWEDFVPQKVKPWFWDYPKKKT